MPEEPLDGALWISVPHIMYFARQRAPGGELIGVSQLKGSPHTVQYHSGTVSRKAFLACGVEKPLSTRVVMREAGLHRMVRCQ